MGCSIVALKVATLELKGPRMTAIIHKISVGTEEKHTLSPEESLRRSVSLGNYTHNSCSIVALKVATLEARSCEPFPSF